jgi:general secretion pathway protein J
LKAARIQGFTLIEMLVALALVSLMSIAMLQAYRFSQRTLAQTTRVDAGVREVAIAQRVLRRLIEQGYPFEVAEGGGSGRAPHGLMGNEDRFALTAPGAAHLGGAGHYRFALSLKDDGGLEVGWGLDRNGANEPAEAISGHEEILDRVKSVSIAYLELVERGNGQIELNWRETWIDKAALPALVRIRVAFDENDRRQWPELIVAPRISADANCVFDVVSQMCRIAS